MGQKIRDTSAKNVSKCSDLKICYGMALAIFVSMAVSIEVRQERRHKLGKWTKEYRAKWQREWLQRRRDNCGLPLIKCAICGKGFRQVGSHVVETHGYAIARDYRREYGFDVKRGQLPEDYKITKAKSAFKTGTYKNLVAGKKYWFKKKGNNVGRYKRSKQTLDRLRKQGLEIGKKYGGSSNGGKIRKSKRNGKA